MYVCVYTYEKGMSLDEYTHMGKWEGGGFEMLVLLAYLDMSKLHDLGGP